ncbi:MAG: hypothetical protein KBONHNOK_00611 [Candidatus Methanoperedenaceae archaeon GB50]|nr:MAG: hypothetical protein KBONHNOK_00611 [Candidatus Methanoperedenaceae archaeon GB50]
MPPPVTGSDWRAASPTSIIPSAIVLLIGPQTGTPPTTTSTTRAEGKFLLTNRVKSSIGIPLSEREPRTPIPTFAIPSPFGKTQTYPPGASLLLR